MSRFYASVSGQGETSITRSGSKKSGIYGHIRGRNIGIEVQGCVDNEGKDHFRVFRTFGSNGYGPDELIAEIVEGK